MGERKAAGPGRGRNPFTAQSGRGREQERAGIAGRYGTTSRSEKLPWVAQGESSPLPEYIWKSVFRLSKDKRPAGTQQQGQSCAQRAENLIGAFYCEPQ